MADGLLNGSEAGYMVGMMWAMIAASMLASGEVGRETLSGTLMDSRELALRIDGSGVTCTGHLTELVEGMGRGSLVCSDHRQGAFHYRLQDDGTGTAYGRLDGKPLALTFD